MDKAGEERFNNFGSKMIISEYINSKNITVYSPQYNWEVKYRDYDGFKRGTIKCPYEPRVYNMGYVGEGKYEVEITD